MSDTSPPHLGWLNARARAPRSLVRLGLRYPGRILALWVAIIALALPGVMRLKIETSTGSVLDRADESWSFYQESQDRFGGDEILTILLEGEKPFDSKALSEVRELTGRFEGIEGVRRVDSLATVPLVWAEPGGELSLEPALSDNAAWSTEAGKRALRSRINRDRIAPRILISEDESAFAINLLLERGAEERYEEILDEVSRQLDGLDAVVSGVPVFRTEADVRTRKELATFVPITVCLVSALLLTIFRSWRAVLAPVLSSGVGCWVVLGLMGFLHVPITIATVLLPSILLALGCAYSMHFLNASTGKAGATELEKALEDLALPVALSGLTTAIGFVAISSVRISAIQDVGTYGAIGVLVVLASALTAGPALLRIAPLPERRLRFREFLVGRGARFVVAAARSHAMGLAVAWVAMLVVLGIGIARLNVETDVIVWFPKDDPVRVSYDRIRSRLSGISPVNIVIESEEGVVRHETLTAIDRLTRDLEALPTVGRAVSVSDPLRQIHRGFTGDESEALPGNDALVEQYLLLLEAKPYMHDLVTKDRSAANIVLRVDDNGSNELLKVGSTMRSLWNEYGPEGVRARATGIMYEFARAEDEIAWGQIRGLVFAFSAVGLLLLAIFRSPGIAIAAMAPNALPIAMAFGFMGMSGIPLDAGTVILGSLALGIAVDDTIHVTTAYVQGRLMGAGGMEALEWAIERVIAPLVYTTLAIALGFLTLGVSDFTLTRNLGLLTTGLMLLCLLADLFLLPLLLVHFGPEKALEKVT